jgi:hypothetical protein
MTEMDALTRMRDRVPVSVTAAETALMAAIRAEHGPATPAASPGRRGRGGAWRAAGAACAAAGLAVALTFAPGSVSRPGPGHAQLAAWTVQTNADGTVTFTLRNTSHPARLQQALAKAGVRAVVRWAEICLAGGRGQPLIGGETAFMKDSPLGGAGAYFAVQGGSGPGPDLDWSWTVIPGKMPRGGQFVISAMPHSVPADDIQAAWEFAKTSAPINCAKLVKPGQEP